MYRHVLQCVVEKRKQTSLKRYGVEHPLQDADIRDKMEETTWKRYGVGHAMQNEEIKEKSKRNAKLKKNNNPQKSV